MTTPEFKVKKAVSKILDAHGVYYFYPSTHGYGRSGIPDIIACKNSIFVAIECKAGKGKTTALQDREIKRIKQAGGITFLINETNINQLTEYLHGI
jgi:Holliday junction resolvase